MAEPVVIDFRIAGIQGVKNAIKSMADAIEEVEADKIKASEKSTMKVIKNAQMTAKAAKEAAERARHAFEDAERSKTKEAEKTARKLAELAKDAARKQAEAYKELSANQRAVFREMTRNEEAFTRAYNAAAKQRFRQQQREHAAAEKAKEASMVARRRGMAGFGGAIASGTGARIGGLASTATSGVALAGMGLIGKGIRDQIELEKRSMGLQVQMKQAGTKGGMDIGQTAKDISGFTNYNVSSLQAVDLMEGIAKSGGPDKLKAYKEQLVDLSKIAVGAQLDFSELGTLVGDLATKGVKSNEIVGVIEKLVEAGRAGAVEMKEMASELNPVLGAMGNMNVSGAREGVMAGGLLEMARTLGKGNAATSKSSVTDFIDTLSAKREDIMRYTGAKKVGTRNIGGRKEDILKGGIDVLDSEGKLKDIGTLLPEIIASMAKNKTLDKLNTKVFSGQSTAITSVLPNVFRAGIVQEKGGGIHVAEKGEKATVKGAKAVEMFFESFTKINVGKDQSAKDFAAITQSSAMKFEATMNKMSSEMGQKLLPRLVEMAPILVQATRAFLDLVTFVNGNLKTSLALALGGSILKDVLSHAVKNMASMYVTSGTVTVTGSPAVNPMGNNLLDRNAGTAFGTNAAASFAAVLAAGAIGFTVGQMIVKDMEVTQKQTDDEVRKKVKEGDAAYMNFTKTGATFADRERAVQNLQQLKRDKANQEGLKGAGNRFISGGWGKVLSGKSKDMGFMDYVSLIPTIGVLQGAYKAATGGVSSDVSQKRDNTINALQGAVDATVSLKPGQTVKIEQFDNLIQAVNKISTRDPSAKPIHSGKLWFIFQHCKEN